MKSQTLYQSSGCSSAWTKRGRTFTRTALRSSSPTSKATSISANSPFFGGIRDGVASTYPESLLTVNGGVVRSLLVAALLYWPFDMRVANHHWRSTPGRSVPASEVPTVRIASRRCREASATDRTACGWTRRSVNQAICTGHTPARDVRRR